MIINCLKCYRVHKCGENVYFCPFFETNPCLRGKHFIANITPKKQPAKIDPKAPKIPAFKPMTSRYYISLQSKRRHFEWEKYHTEIFTRYFNGEGPYNIAKAIGTTGQQVEYYINRYFKGGMG